MNYNSTDCICACTTYNMLDGYQQCTPPVQDFRFEVLLLFRGRNTQHIVGEPFDFGLCANGTWTFGTLVQLPRLVKWDWCYR